MFSPHPATLFLFQFQLNQSGLSHAECYLWYHRELFIAICWLSC